METSNWFRTKRKAPDSGHEDEAGPSTRRRQQRVVNKAQDRQDTPFDCDAADAGVGELMLGESAFSLRGNNELRVFTSLAWASSSPSPELEVQFHNCGQCSGCGQYMEKLKPLCSSCNEARRKQPEIHVEAELETLQKKAQPSREQSLERKQTPPEESPSPVRPFWSSAALCH